jgi:hypothetical protein
VEHVTGARAGVALTVNFRSVPEVLDAVNRLFTGVDREIPERTIEPEYIPIHPFHPRGGENAEVEIWSVESQGNSAGDRRRAEAAVLARELRSWLDSGSIRPKQIAVLFRALTDTPLYTRALRQAGIEFVVEGGKAFAERPEVVESFALLRALSNPGDAVPLLGVLRFSFGGVTDAELAGFVASGGVLQWMSAQTGAPPRIAGVFARLRELDALRLRLPLDRWVLSALTETEFLLTQAAYEQAPAGGQCAEARARGRDARPGAQAHPREALDDVEDVFAAIAPRKPLADEAVDAVHPVDPQGQGARVPGDRGSDLARGSAPTARSAGETILGNEEPDRDFDPRSGQALNAAGLAACATGAS